MIRPDPETLIRATAARMAALHAELRDLELRIGPVERDYSRSLGYSFPPLRGRALLEVMDRQAGRAVA